MSPIKEEQKDAEVEESSNGGDETYVVEKILNTRRRNGRREYLIKWEGWPVEDSTWEEERHCTHCQEAIDEFNRNRSLAGKDDNAILVGDDPKQKTPKTKSRRRTISKSQSGSAKKQKLSPVKAKKEVSDTPVKNGVRATRRSVSGTSNSPKKSTSNEQLKTETSDRGMSCDSDDGSVRDRFLKVKKPKSPDTESATESTSDTTEQVYKLQQGKELESIIGVNKEGAQLLYAVQYKGPEPKHQRIELVPSKVLRTHAMETPDSSLSKLGALMSLSLLDKLKESDNFSSHGMATHTDAPHCRVCERSYDGSQHFGIEVCRACAAFFRRSIESRKKFVCRKGGNRCQLNAPRRVMCQKCRLTRCLSVGLQPELVQCKRTQYRDGVWNCPPDFKVERPSSSNEMMMPRVCQMDIGTDGTIFRPIPTVNPVYTTDSSAHLKPNLVYKVLQNYRRMYADRWAMELSVPGCEDAPTYNAAGKILSLVSLDRLSDIMRKQMTYISRFTIESFEDFSSFSPTEQQYLMRMVFSVMWQLEGSYWTYRNLPAQQVEKMMLSLTTYSDLNNLEYLISGANEPQDVSQLKEVITSLQMYIRSTLLDQMHGIILSEIEFVALLTLTIWSPRHHRGCEKAARIASKYRAQVFYDLHAHYRDERKMDNYANRFGDIMCLFVDLQMNSSRIGEDVELLKLFNMYKIDSYIYECLNLHQKNFQPMMSA